MPRAPRVVIPGVPHHVTQRGNQRRQIFFSNSDCQLYMSVFADSAERVGVRLWGWCLMPNHVHWIVEPRDEVGLSRLVQRAHGEYARYRQRLRGVYGHLWQARFFSCPLDESHRWTALAYVERNPVRGGLVHEAERYEWSSAAARLGVVPTPSFLEASAWRERYTVERWREALATSLAAEEDAERLRVATLTGRPMADGATLAGWAAMVGNAGAGVRNASSGKAPSGARHQPSEMAAAAG